MQRFMDWLHEACKPVIGANWFEGFMVIFIIVNPIALSLQVIKAYTAPSVEGIAVGMWYVFVGIQVAYAAHGLKTRSAAVFFTQLVCILESIAVIAAVHIRS